MLKNSDAEHHKSFNVLPGYAVMHFFIVFSGFVFPGSPMPDWGDQGSTKSCSSFTRSGCTGEKWGAGLEKAAHKKLSQAIPQECRDIQIIGIDYLRLEFPGKILHSLGLLA